MIVNAKNAISGSKKFLPIFLLRMYIMSLIILNILIMCRQLDQHQIEIYKFPPSELDPKVRERYMSYQLEEWSNFKSGIIIYKNIVNMKWRRKIDPYCFRRCHQTWINIDFSGRMDERAATLRSGEDNL